MMSTVLTFPIAYTPPKIVAPKPIFPPPGFELEEKVERCNLKKLELLLDSFSDKECVSLKRFRIDHEKQFTKPYVYSQYSKPFFRPYKFNHFNDWNKFRYRKSAYAVAIVTDDFLTMIGATKIKDGIYIAMKNGIGCLNQEACAIIALSRTFAEQLLVSNSEIYDILKECAQLQSIAGIKDLSPYRLDVLLRTGKTFEDVEKSEFVLFNIEPRGEAVRDKLQYPFPNICLPGGGMESRDNRSWERTLFREFEEEVGVKLQPEDIKIIEQRKSSAAHRNAVYFWLKILPKSGSI